MAQPPGTGTYEQVLRMLALMAGTPALAAEAEALKANLRPGQLIYTVRDLNSQTYMLDLGEQQFRSTAWLKTKFQHVDLTPGIRLIPPYPCMQLIGGPTANARGGGMEEAEYAQYTNNIDAIIWYQTDDAQSAQRGALILGQAFQQLVKRNSSLGGLVELIRPLGQVQPGGGGKPPAGVVMAARVRLEFTTLFF